MRIVLGISGLTLLSLALLGGVLLIQSEPSAPQTDSPLFQDAVVSRSEPLGRQDRAPLDADSPKRIESKAPAPDPVLFSPAAYSLDKIVDAERRALVAQGKRLIVETYALIGPGVEDKSKRFAGNQLACKNCHLDAGLKPYAGSYVGVTKRYPSFRARENKMGTIEERINGCMERSMNGKPLPKQSDEMRAIVAYMEWLSHIAPPDGKVAGKGFVPADFPDRAADLTQGSKVYSSRCAVCHGAEGLGLKLPTQVGYQFPPVAGDDSYNHGAGMHRVLTAMAFIRGNMPLGATSENPQLSYEEAYDVAAYINTLKRPQKENTERDFPELKLKPMSTPYPPYVDNFPIEQHKLGPFSPIYVYYLNEHQVKKNK